jgi:hypothetical protein
LLENVNGKYLSEDLGETLWEDVDWIHLVDHRHQWWDLMNMLMNLRIQ